MNNAILFALHPSSLHNRELLVQVGRQSEFLFLISRRNRRRVVASGTHCCLCLRFCFLGRRSICMPFQLRPLISFRLSFVALTSFPTCVVEARIRPAQQNDYCSDADRPSPREYVDTGANPR